MMDQSISFMLITILVLSALSLGMITFFAELGDKYSATVTAPVTDEERALIENINYTGRVYHNITSDLQEKITSTQEKNILENIADVFIGSVVTGVLFLVNVPGLILAFIGTMLAPLSVFGMPGWVLDMVTGIVSLMIVLIIIRIIMKWKF